MAGTGRKDDGYAEMHDDGPYYRMRVKAHFANGAESGWTDWLDACKAPHFAVAVPPSSNADCEEDNPSPPTGQAQAWEPKLSIRALPASARPVQLIGAVNSTV